eukprot:scaffold11731_cov119-Isochrysis_galbana.AAC.9
MMTDPPSDDTEAREQEAPGTTDAKHRAPLHGHTGAVPPDNRQPTRHSPTTSASAQPPSPVQPPAAPAVATFQTARIPDQPVRAAGCGCRMPGCTLHRAPRATSHISPPLAMTSNNRKLRFQSKTKRCPVPTRS